MTGCTRSFPFTRMMLQCYPMRLLLPAAFAVFTVSSFAFAEEPPCEQTRIIQSWPSDGQVDVPTDSRVVLYVVDGCESLGEVSLYAPGEALAITRMTWGHTHIALQPDEEMAPDTEHRIQFEGLDETVSFFTGTSKTPALEELPSLTVHQIAYEPPLGTSGEVYEADFTLTPAGSDPLGFAFVLFEEGGSFPGESQGVDWSITTTPMGSGPARATLYRTLVPSDGPVCLVARQQDGAGRLGEPVRACADPVAVEGLHGEPPSSCSFGPGSAGRSGPWVLLFLIGVSLRRRNRLCTERGRVGYWSAR